MGAGITSGECSKQETVNISQEKASEWLYSTTDTFLIAVIIPTLWCLALITNMTFLLVTLRVRTLRSETNYYLAHLALADLLYVSLASAITWWSYTASPLASHFPFVNSAQCIISSTFVNTGYFASIVLVTMVSFERYLALCHPMKHRQIRGQRRTYRIVAICWMAGCLLSVSITMENTVQTMECLLWPDDDSYQSYPSIRVYCGPVAPWITNYTHPLQNVPWLVATVANTHMYLCIILTLNKRTSDNDLANNDPNASQIRNQVAKILVVNGTVFFLCQTPYRIFSMAEWICSLAEIPNPMSAALGRNTRWISSIPQYINGMINPLIYGAMNRAYRAAFRQAFRCNCQSRSQHTASPTVRSEKSQNKARQKTHEQTESLHPDCELGDLSTLGINAIVGPTNDVSL
ncbi:neuromedin-U receptor 2-like [Acanthaster planci]|uniref:Neuromedin-U receptor 2-like n=1 Tax=Acanthaster planci TaxID=133434 RepID=A0A8B7XME9_ACAPL|nr:neuromedin-U receptor 2-like [Acanthaster planci]